MEVILAGAKRQKVGTVWTQALGLRLGVSLQKVADWFEPVTTDGDCLLGPCT